MTGSDLRDFVRFDSVLARELVRETASLAVARRPAGRAEWNRVRSSRLGTGIDASRSAYVLSCAGRFSLRTSTSLAARRPQSPVWQSPRGQITI